MTMWRQRARNAFRTSVAVPTRTRSQRLLDTHAPRLAEKLYRVADRVAGLPFHADSIELPTSAAHDVVADLVSFTKLPRALVEAELADRSRTSFRSEWHATAPEFRQDHWFYLSAKGYLFGNAVHHPGPAFVQSFVKPFVAEGARILDFGAGTGNLALTLSAAGYRLSAVELSTLQRDFIRFRIARHSLEASVEVVDWWDPLPEAAYDMICALDVLEHLPEPQAVLGGRLLPALRPDGVLVENSPFVINASNPMHHEDFGFDAYMDAAGFENVLTAPDRTRVWSRRPGDAAD